MRDSSDVAAASHRTQRGVSMATSSKREVLVVDDDPSIRESLALLLVTAGYDVASAQDGFAALLQLRRTLPHLIVSDLNMPHIAARCDAAIARNRDAGQRVYDAHSAQYHDPDAQERDFLDRE